MPRKDIDYSKCIIYKIVCNDFDVKDIYVGHTTDLVKRRSQHKNSCNGNYNSLKIYYTIRENGGWENWSVVVIERFETCKDSEDARTRERYWFDELNANLNSVRPFATQEESKEIKKQYYAKHKDKIQEQLKQYYVENKDYLQEHQKQYYADNIENVLDQKKQYYAKHKDKILEQQAKPFLCDCGRICRTNNKLRHLKSKKHLELCELII